MPPLNNHSFSISYANTRGTTPANCKKNRKNISNCFVMLKLGKFANLAANSPFANAFVLAATMSRSGGRAIQYPRLASPLRPAVAQASPYRQY
jgi:hypothetical protein